MSFVVVVVPLFAVGASIVRLASRTVGRTEWVVWVSLAELSALSEFALLEGSSVVESQGFVVGSLFMLVLIMGWLCFSLVEASEFSL